MSGQPPASSTDLARHALEGELLRAGEGSLEERFVDRLWLRMTEMFGVRWTKQYGERDSDGFWARGLADMQPEELKAGLAAVLDSGAIWPPSLPEFRKLCRPGKVRRVNGAAYSTGQRQLPHRLTQEQRERGRAHIAEARAALMGGKRG